ncbi:MAG: uracil-DNA glycosylase family protein [Candidatus Micrarchaeia archaeon]
MAIQNFEKVVLLYKRDRRNIRFLFLEKNDNFCIGKRQIKHGNWIYKTAHGKILDKTRININVDPFFKRMIKFEYKKGGDLVRANVAISIAKVNNSIAIKLGKHCMWFDIKQIQKKKIPENCKELVKDAIEYINKKDKLDKLNLAYRKLPYKFKNWDLSRRYVPGEGPVNADVMVIGQAPGKMEDILQRPFVGRSGKLLDYLLKIAKLERNSVYITSVVQFFPPDNRKPNNAEINICREFLLEQIKIINPKLIILLGAVSTGEVLGKTDIMKIHGKIFKKRYFATLHPAAAVRIKRNLPIIERDFKKLRRLLLNKKLLEKTYS